MSLTERSDHYTNYLREAKQWAAKLHSEGPVAEHALEDRLRNLQFFSLPESCMQTLIKPARKGLLKKIKASISPG